MFPRIGITPLALVGQTTIKIRIGRNIPKAKDDSGG
jgi:hypothetical protein